MTEYIAKAKVLIEALPYIKEFNGITVVIKYGGSALMDTEIKKSTVKDIALMKFVGLNPVVVHGGGPEINRMLDRVGIVSEFKNGLRVTDAESMEIVEMVLAGKAGKAIAADITMQGIPAVSLSGKDAGLLKVRKVTPGGADIGFVGEVTEVNTSLIKTLVSQGYVPVISPVGTDEPGQTYNINADYAAAAVAGALSAEKLVFLTDVPGLLRDANDPESLIRRIGADEVREMAARGEITGGMIPKADCCVAGVEAGVPHVHILDGRVEHALILEIFTKEGIGTMVVNGRT